MGTSSDIDSSGIIERYRPFLQDLRHALYLVRRSPLSLLGVILFLGFVLTAALAPYIAPYNPLKINLRGAFQPPSKEHLFGTDELGRDILSRILWGCRISLQVGVTVVAISLSIGTILGGIAGYLGGVVDEIIMRFTDLVLAFPSIILALALAAALGPGLNNAIFAISITWWPWYSRLVRGQVLSIRETGFVEAARCVGASDIRILFRHILPNSFGPVIVNASMDFGWAILMTSALGFLGIGAQPPKPEWGVMINAGRIYFMDKPWISTFPGLAILIVVLASNLIGDGLGEILNPRLRRR
jgi:peptide/nickel transport system permease protein